MLKITSVTKQGVGANNEDALIQNDSLLIYGVLDGVSSLVPYVSNDGKKGGEIASSLVRSYFEELKKSDDLKDELQLANEKLRAVMDQVQLDRSQKEALWGTAAAIVQLTAEHIHFVQVGDCMIFAVHIDGSVRALTYPQVAHLEELAFHQWDEAIRQGINTRSQLIEVVREQLTQNRYMSNVTGGYGVLNGEECFGSFMDYGEISRNNIQKLILVTDGLFPPTTDYLAQPDWVGMVEYILSEGLEAYVDHVLALEAGDPECTSYYRFKKSDDKTGMILTLID